jgi:hypothetical protein
MHAWPERFPGRPLWVILLIFLLYLGLTPVEEDFGVK